MSFAASCSSVPPDACVWLHKHTFSEATKATMTRAELLQEADHNDMVEERCR